MDCFVLSMFLLERNEAGMRGGICAHKHSQLTLGFTRVSSPAAPAAPRLEPHIVQTPKTHVINGFKEW